MIIDWSFRPLVIVGTIAIRTTGGSKEFPGSDHLSEFSTRKAEVDKAAFLELHLLVTFHLITHQIVASLDSSVIV